MRYSAKQYTVHCYAECRSEVHSAECRYAERLSAECHGASVMSVSISVLVLLNRPIVHA
jgi:hypothetical protein